MTPWEPGAAHDGAGEAMEAEVQLIAQGQPRTLENGDPHL